MTFGERIKELRESKELLASSFADELQDTQLLLDQGFSEKSRLRQAERSFASFSGEADQQQGTAFLLFQIGAKIQPVLEF